METAIKQSHQQQDSFRTSIFVGVQVRGLKWHTCLHSHTRSFTQALVHTLAHRVLNSISI